MSKCECEKCLHYDACKKISDVHGLAFGSSPFCDHYKDKSLFVELPCATGIPLYFLYNRPYADKPDLIPQIYETNEWYFEIDEKEIAICPRMIHGLNGNYYYHIGKTVFLTEEQAKAKLKEMGGKK